MKRKFLSLFLSIIAVLLVLSSCSSQSRNLNGLIVTSVKVVFDFDENTKNYNPKAYSFSFVKSDNSSIKDHCTFTFYEERKTEWSVDPDGTKHIHATGGMDKTVEYELSIFENIIKIIKNGSPSIYSGPESDSNGKLVYKIIPYMIILEGTDKNGKHTKVYIDSINNKDKLLETITNLVNTE